MPMIAPFVPALIKGGIALGGAFAGSKLAGKKSPEEKSALDLSSQALGETKPFASQFLNYSTRAYNPVLDYWGRILAGSRGDAYSILSPEIKGLQDRYKMARESAANLLPRGGGRSALMADLPFREASDVSSLLQTARPQAATALERIGGETAGIGQGLYGTTLRGAEGLLDYGLRRKSQEFAMAKGIGSILYDLLKSLNLSGGKTDISGIASKTPVGMPPSARPIPDIFK